MATTIYSWVWDCYMDWGLWRTTEKGKWGLRSVITYPVWFYWYGIVSDAVLRLLWIPAVFLDGNTTPWITTIGYGTLLAVLELWRRWTWSLLRIENEQVSNLEKYRVVLDIPDVNDVQADE